MISLKPSSWPDNKNNNNQIIDMIKTSATKWTILLNFVFSDFNKKYEEQIINIIFPTDPKVLIIFIINKL